MGWEGWSLSIKKQERAYFFMEEQNALCLVSPLLSSKLPVSPLSDSELTIPGWHNSLLEFGNQNRTGGNASFSAILAYCILTGYIFEHLPLSSRKPHHDIQQPGGLTFLYLRKHSCEDCVYLGFLLRHLTLAILGGPEALEHKDTLCTRHLAPL